MSTARRILLYRFLFFFSLLSYFGQSFAQEYATPYEKSKAKIITAEVKQASFERRLLEGNTNQDPDLNEGMPQYAIAGPEYVDRLSTQTYSSIPQVFEGCWWFVSHGTVNNFYDDLIEVNFSTNVNQVTIKMFSPQDSLLAVFLVLEVKGDQYPLSPGEIKTGNQSVNFDEIPKSISANIAEGGICSTYRYVWQYSTIKETGPFDEWYEDNPDTLHFDGPIDSSVFIRRMVICGDDSAFTAPVHIKLKSLTPSVFDPGKISTLSFSVLPGETIPEILASEATGNSDCSTVTIDWEKSTNGVGFTSLGVSSKNLSYSDPLNQTTFFRRKAECGSITAYTNSIYVAVIDTTTPPPPPVAPTEIDSLLAETGSIIDSIFNIKIDSTENYRTKINSVADQMVTVATLGQQVININNSDKTLSPDEIYMIENAEVVDDIEKKIDNLQAGNGHSDSTPVYLPEITDSMLIEIKQSGNYERLDELLSTAPEVSFEEAFFTVEQQLKDSLGPEKDTTFLEEKYFRHTVTIQGDVVVGYDHIKRYTAEFMTPFSESDPTDIRWIVKGGTIVAKNTDPTKGDIFVDINWIKNIDIPFVALIDTRSRQYARPMPVYFRPIPCQTYPFIQIGYYEQALTTLRTSDCFSNIPEGYTQEYQWQMLDFYGTNTWNDIIGSTNPFYLAMATVPVSGYRRITVLKDNLGITVSTSTSIPAWIFMKAVHPGLAIPIISRVPYNTSPVVATFPAFGGMASYNPIYYSYSWKASVNDGPWTEIGTTQEFPSTYKVKDFKVMVKRDVTLTNVPQTVFNYPARYWSASTPPFLLTYYYVTQDYENRNYIRENAVLTRGINNWEDADLLPVDKKIQTTTYLDGLSRPIQVVGKGTHYDETSNQWYDMVKSITYEAGGRVDKSLLPYPTNANSGKFKTDAATAQPAYYQAQFGDNNAFAKVDYDNSPLNRVKAAYAPGNGWVGSSVKVSGEVVPYDIAEGVRIFKAPHYDFENFHSFYANDDVIPKSNGVYGNLQLIKTVGTDEKGKKVISYTDKNGNTVLKKVQLAEGAALTNQHAGWLCTYYVYDDLNQLRYTIPPKAVVELEQNYWGAFEEHRILVTEELCFWYRYDDLGRLCVKKTPGKGIEGTVYDFRNRPVAVSDAGISGYSETQGLVLLTLYDDLNRPVMTGLHREKIYYLAEWFAVKNSQITVVNTAHGGPIRVCGLPAEVADLLGDYHHFTELSFTYYDNYGFNGAHTFDVSQVTNLGYRNASGGGDVDPVSQTLRYSGMVTGTKTRVMNNASTPAFLTSTVFYDEEGRGIQSKEENVGGGVDIATTQYHFDGRVLSTKETHTMPNTAYVGLTTLTKYKFSKSGRVTAIAKKIHSTTVSYATNTNMVGIEEDADANYKITASYKYNELGRRIKKTISPGYNNGQGLETIDYSYNIRGWLTGINKEYALGEYNTSQWQHYFGMYLGYNNADGKFAAAQYNGSITGVLWKSQGDNTPRKFDYEYDNANRLIKASYNQRGTSTESWNRLKVDFSTKNITYDENGNILTLTNMGILPGASAPVAVDNLSYTYKEVTNRLTRVDDGGTAGTANGKQGDFKDGNNAAGTQDYSYDEQGRLVLDNNKRITNIKYNYLDKPVEIVVDPPAGSTTGGGVISYIYDAGGSKLKKTVEEYPTPQNGNSTIVTTTTYIGAYIYSQVTTTPDGGTATVGAVELQMIQHEEGRIRVITPYINSNDQLNEISGGIDLPGGKQGVFDYFIKDNLGNVRVTITEEFNKAGSICTMEDGNATVKATEEGAFGNPGSGNEVNTTRTDRPVAWTSCVLPGQTINDNHKVSMLKAVGGVAKIGPNALLRVMAGDEVNAKADYYYQTDPGPSSNSAVTTLVNGLLSALTGGRTSASTHGAEAAIGTSLGANPDMADFFDGPPNNGTPNNDAPRAYLNYIFFDEQFNFVEQVSGFERVRTSGDNAAPLVMQVTKAIKNGYVYVYLSNETNTEVYFDNFQVNHKRGQLIADDHYYAYGLRIAAISSKAVSSSLNPKTVNFGYSGSFAEELEDFGLNYNEFFFRTYDPQIGRWTTVDPYNEFPSPYTGIGNDPINNTDPSGGTLAAFLGLSPMATAVVTSVAGGMIGGLIDMIAGGDGGTGFAIGAGIGLLGGLSATLSSVSSMHMSLSSAFAVGGNILVAINQPTPQITANILAPTFDYISTPTSIGDLGVTDYKKNFSITFDENTNKYSVSFNVQTRYSSSFGPDGNGPMEQQNPGLFSQTQAHEEGHQGQFDDASKTKIKIKFNKKDYENTADEVMNEIKKDYDDETKRESESIDESKRKKYVDKRMKQFKEVESEAMNSVKQALDKKLKNLEETLDLQPGKYNDEPAENDANERAVKKLGHPLKYHGGNLPKYNGIILQ